MAFNVFTVREKKLILRLRVNREGGNFITFAFKEV